MRIAVRHYPFVRQEHSVINEKPLEGATCPFVMGGDRAKGWRPTPCVWRCLLAGCLLLLFGAAPFWLMATDQEAARWTPFFVLIGFSVVLETVLRSDALDLWRWLGSKPFLRKRWNWFRFCLATVALVFLVEAVSIAGYGHFPVLPHVVGIALNAFLLVCLAAFVFSVTNRFAFSVALTYSAYLLAFVANMLKVQYLQTIIRPLDIHYLTAFGEYSTLFLGKAVIVLSVVGVAVWAVAMGVLWWKGRYRVGLRARALLAVAAVAGFVAVMVCDKCPPVSYALRCLHMHKNMSNGLLFGERRGFLFEFVSDIPNSISFPPANYTRDEVVRAMNEHYGPASTQAATSESQEGVNVIVYLIESFMDPMDLNIKFTSDPIPNFRAATRRHTSGHIVVPNVFCGSTNTEFEILTGMSCSYLPQGACPYVQYVKRDIPSLPEFLRSRGYATFAAHAGPPCLYDRVRVYQHLKVGETIWLTERTKEKVGMPSDIGTICPIDVDIAGRCPTDDSLVDAVIEVSEKNPRYFMYASANTTHSPYDYDGYLASDLDVCDPLSTPAKNELKTYINALRTSDRAIGRLFDHFRNSPQKTIIVIVGDHRAPFQNSNEIYAASGCLTPSDAGSLPEARLVPLLIWSNFAEKGPDVVCSTNFLPTDILARAGVQPAGFLALNDALRSDLTVMSNECIQTRDGRIVTSDPVPESVAHGMHDYRLLQYDMLLGKRYGVESQQDRHNQANRSAQPSNAPTETTLDRDRLPRRSPS